MNKWVERAAIITGSLSLIGVVVVSFITISDTGNKGIFKPSTKVVKAVHKPQTAVLTPAAKEVKQIENLPAINNVEAPIAEKKESPKAKVDHKDISKSASKAKETPKPAIKHKWLTKEDLRDLLTAINNRKRYNSTNYNCVQIQSLKGANNKRATAQVEEYLSFKKFTITGRELITHSRKGINIQSKGKCLTVIIGNL